MDPPTLPTRPRPTPTLRSRGLTMAMRSPTPPRLGGMLQRPRPRRSAHDGWPPDAVGPDRSGGRPRRPDGLRVGGPVGARRAHRHRPAQRRRAWSRCCAAAGLGHDGPPAARRIRGPRVLGHLGQRAAVRDAAVLRPAPAAVPGAQRRGAVRRRSGGARRRGGPLRIGARPRRAGDDAAAGPGRRRRRGHRRRLRAERCSGWQRATRPAGSPTRGRWSRRSSPIAARRAPSSSRRWCATSTSRRRCSTRD